MAAQASTTQKVIGQLQASRRFLVLGDTGERGQPILGAKGLAHQIDFIGNRKMEGSCRLLHSLGMAFAADIRHAVGMGRLLDETGMGCLFVGGQRIATMAIVTGKIMLLIQGQGVTTPAAQNSLLLDGIICTDDLEGGVTL